MYLVTAYRWGWTNAHQYPVYCGPDRARALSLAESERDHRGGKYGCAVYEWNAEGTQSSRIAYFGASMNGESEPSHNWRLDYLTRLGHTLEAYVSGEVYVTVQEGTFNVLRPEKIDPPPAKVLAEVSRHKAFYEGMIKANLP